MSLHKFNSSDIDLYLTALRDEPTPFDIFVSRAGKAAVKDKFDLATPRSRATRTVRRALNNTMQDGVTRLVPIIGPAGSGKTHFYWHLKDEEEAQVDPKFVVCYIPSPPSAVRIPLHLYTCILDEIGEDLLNSVSKKIISDNSKQSTNFKDILTNSIRSYPGISSDVIKALILFKLGEQSNIRLLAERYLLGESLSEEELEELAVSRIIEDDDIVLASIRVLFENYDKVVVLYFDELEIPYRTMGRQTAAAFIEHLKRMYNELRNLLIITACLTDIWPEIYASLDEAMKSRLERESQLLPFSGEDIETFYKDAMNHWWLENQNIEPPENLLFPLEHSHFAEILDESKGNPRNTIKAIRMKLDDTIEDRFQSPDRKIVSDEKENRKTSAVESQTEISTLTPEQLEILENITIEINPSSIIAGLASSLKQSFSHANLEENVEFEYKGKIRFLALIFTFNDNKIGIEVPSVKSFDKRGGVAAYYALNRLTEAINEEIITTGILLVPSNTSGKKYQSALQSVEHIVKVIEFNQHEAESLIKHGLIKQITPKVNELIDLIKKLS
jgi:GTPase SAR1 family protein